MKLKIDGAFKRVYRKLEEKKVWRKNERSLRNKDDIILKIAMWNLISDERETTRFIYSFDPTQHVRQIPIGPTNMQKSNQFRLVEEVWELSVIERDRERE